MANIPQFEQALDEKNRDIFRRLNSPADIQAYLDSISYDGGDLNRSPLRVMQDRRSHCLDGGIFAALTLSRIGYRPLILDLVPAAGLDDDHVLAVFKSQGRFGAVAKSNFVGLRYREPVYRSLRELAMSYFEAFFNIDRVKTLRGYTRPLNLNRFDRIAWTTQEDAVEVVVQHLYSLPSIALLDEAQAAALLPVDRRSYEAGMLGINYEGLYHPGSGH